MFRVKALYKLTTVPLYLYNICQVIRATIGKVACSSDKRGDQSSLVDENRAHRYTERGRQQYSARRGWNGHSRRQYTGPRRGTRQASTSTCRCRLPQRRTRCCRSSGQGRASQDGSRRQRSGSEVQNTLPVPRPGYFYTSLTHSQF